MEKTLNRDTIYGLDIHLVSFKLPDSLVKDNDDIRVSITTLPNQQKQYFILKSKNMSNTNFDFTVNITPATEKIVMVFRKKSFIFNDPIIASTIIHREDFPSYTLNESVQNKTEVKVMNIFEPIQRNHESQKINKNGTYEFNQDVTNKKNRLIIGQMQLQMTLSNPFSLQDIQNISHHVKGQRGQKHFLRHHSFKKRHFGSSENRNDYQSIA